MVAASVPAETRTVLENISWQTFKIGNRPTPRLSTRGGILQTSSRQVETLRFNGNSRILAV